MTSPDYYDRASLDVTTTRVRPGANSDAAFLDVLRGRQEEFGSYNEDLAQKILEILGSRGLNLEVFIAGKPLTISPQLSSQKGSNGEVKSIKWVNPSGRNSLNSEGLIKHAIYKTAKFSDEKNNNPRVFIQTSKAPLQISEQTYKYLMETDSGKTLLEQNPSLYPQK